MYIQNLEHLCYEIPIFTLMASKNEQSLKQHCHLYQKKENKNRSKLHLKIMSIELLTGKNLPST